MSTLTRIDLARSFSVASDTPEETDDWLRFFRKRSGEYVWSDLHEHRIVVVLGEAGIGKTVELQNEVGRLRRVGKSAFFIQLNQVLDKDSWELVVKDSQPDFVRWEGSADIGYFFFDAVDEARLVNHSAFERALLVIKSALSHNMSRVRVVISSRITDWAVDSVRDSVQTHLTGPIENAHRVAADRTSRDDVIGGSTVSEKPQKESVDAFVVSLHPLSKGEAEKLANSLGVNDAVGFWAAIEDGDYEFMATRPLDLVWMVTRWNDKRTLGTYLELVESNVSNRLIETNPSYQQAGGSPSLDSLRRGVEQLAAATALGGRSFVSTTNSAKANEVSPTLAISDWGPLEISRLLGCAIFDEATFGRVKFHHRSIREFLAANWIYQKLKNGLPLHCVLPLFSSAPFGFAVLIPSRRAILCWLAALNVEVREWVARNFPEMLFFEGDPEAWDIATANLAFDAFIERLRSGFRTEWWNDASETRRIARRLPPGRVAELLAEYQSDSIVVSALLPLVKHGRLFDCAQVVYEMYVRANGSSRQQHHALIVLSAVASSDHRRHIQIALLGGRIRSNELIAAALAVVDWPTFAVEELVHVFSNTESEGGYGSGPMARVIKDEILPETNAVSAELLLTAVVRALAPPKNGKRYEAYPEANQPERAWLFNVLPDCTERLISLIPTGSKDFPRIALLAAERLEAILESGLTRREDARKLHGLISERPALRWQIALAIGRSPDIRYATNRLTWGGNSLVSFDKVDLPEIVLRANDAQAQASDRETWFRVGIRLAFRELKGKQRRNILSDLLSGSEKEARRSTIDVLRSEWLEGMKQRRKYQSDERTRRREKREAHRLNKDQISRDIEKIRDGSLLETIHWLINYSYNRSGRNSLTSIDLDTIRRDFGAAIAEALESGLLAAWPKIEPPNPANYPGGELPWEAITGLVALHVLFGRENGLTDLSNEDAARAAQLAVWELNAPPPWFERIVQGHEATILVSLTPWLEAECIEPSNAHRIRGALELALSSPTSIRASLLRPALRLVQDNRIANPSTLKALVTALRQDTLLDAQAVAEICQRSIETSLTADQLIADLGWFRTWLEQDLRGAWEWFENHVSRIGVVGSKQVYEVASGLVESKWLREPSLEIHVPALLGMYKFLNTYSESVPIENPGRPTHGLGNPVIRLLQAICLILVQIRGEAAHHALAAINALNPSGLSKEWLNSRVVEHAGLDAQHVALLEPSELKTFGDPLLFEPRSERELFDQTIARLEEIRTVTEEGPFSDRSLFPAGITEKSLQLWMAARFRDTGNRRFSVHREEVVDADKRTDIQLSCRFGNVCVEIKPLDATRRYSAATLVDTLRTQIVGQYLKRLNSTHGILVLFRLDKKAWKIPGKSKPQAFHDLVAYLQGKADSVRHDHPEVNALRIFGIDCLK